MVHMPAGAHCDAPSTKIRYPAVPSAVLKLLAALGSATVSAPEDAFRWPDVVMSDCRRIAPPQSPPNSGVGNVFGHTPSASPLIEGASGAACAPSNFGSVTVIVFE